MAALGEVSLDEGQALALCDVLLEGGRVDPDRLAALYLGLAHGDAWRTMINDLYGSEDQISIVYFETPVVADNLVQRTIEEDDPSLATLAPQPR